MPKNANDMNGINIDADGFLNTPEGKKLAGRRGDLERLAASEDGKRVRALLSETDVENAAKSGDFASVAAAVKSALSTEEGARLADKLRELMK
ncbi:MAG: hypothetical protein LBK23_10730 [Oscillospiraceae bacterium]|jgi:hypothetical protein|nr:hypothetical protein [Oscillospiraceae bacterium]